jgi:hypothetical protein
LNINTFNPHLQKPKTVRCNFRDQQMEKKYSLKIVSVSKELRLCIIENSIIIEELASEVIGNILIISWKNSKSFGHTSTSLSFLQKLQLIQDIKGFDKEDLKEITCLANIRNKFAHVSNIYSFKSLFTDSNVGNNVKIKLLKWYFKKNNYDEIESSNFELLLRHCFYLLVDEVASILLEINLNQTFNEGVAAGKRLRTEQLLNYCMSILTEKQRKETLKEIERFELVN